MKNRHRVLPVVLLAALAALVLCAGAGAAMVGIYRNALDTTTQRSEALKLTGQACARGGGEGTLKVTVGKQTEECAYRTPVVGHNLEISATERLLTGTPKAVAKKAFLGLILRAGGDARYELRVFPGQKKTQLTKVTKEGGIEYLAIMKRVAAVKGLNEANVLRLRAEGAKGKVKITGYLGAEVVGEAVDEGGGVEGESSAVAVGALKNGVGAVASFDEIVVRVPVRF